MLDDDAAATARVVRDSSGKQTVPDTIMQQCGTYLALHNPLVRGYRLLKDVATLEAVDGRLADLVLVVHDETARPDPGTHPRNWTIPTADGMPPPLPPPPHPVDIQSVLLCCWDSRGWRVRVCARVCVSNRTVHSRVQGRSLLSLSPDQATTSPSTETLLSLSGSPTTMANFRTLNPGAP